MIKFADCLAATDQLAPPLKVEWLTEDHRDLQVNVVPRGFQEDLLKVSWKAQVEVIH